jgi:predicted lipoprotein with Yx(FWY)xxD motif
MKITSIAFALVASILFAACGGGGSTGSSAYTPTIPQPQPTATVASTVLQTAVLKGSPAFVTANNMPVYTFGGDTTANQSTCTGGCLQIWPAVAAATGTLPAPWASFTRGDNGMLQLSYKGQPLYTFASDSPGVANGDGVENFHLARP